MNDFEKSNPDDLNALQLRKVRQEIEKLEVEIKILNRAWWKQAPYIAAILPIIAVSVTAWIAYSTSAFKHDAELAKSEIARLKPEADSLKQQVVRLQQEEALLKPERDRLAAEVRVLQPKATVLQQQIVTFNNRISTWRSQLVEINTRLKTVMPPVAGVAVFPPPSAEPERKRLQKVIDSMLSTLTSK